MAFILQNRTVNWRGLQGTCEKKEREGEQKGFCASNQYYLVFVQILIFDKEKESTKMESGGKGTNKTTKNQ